MELVPVGLGYYSLGEDTTQFPSITSHSHCTPTIGIPSYDHSVPYTPGYSLYSTLGYILYFQGLSILVLPGSSLGGPQ